MTLLTTLWAMAAILGAVVINAIVAMANTSNIDKYWVLHPEWESSYMYRQLWRFHKYGLYVLCRHKPLIDPPSSIKWWLGISFIINWGFILSVVFVRLVLMP